MCCGGKEPSKTGKKLAQLGAFVTAFNLYAALAYHPIRRYVHSLRMGRPPTSPFNAHSTQKRGQRPRPFAIYPHFLAADVS